MTNIHGQEIFNPFKVMAEIVTKDEYEKLQEERNKENGIECFDCGTVYLKGEDIRLESGMKCTRCAYQFGD